MELTIIEASSHTYNMTLKDSAGDLIPLDDSQVLVTIKGSKTETAIIIKDSVLGTLTVTGTGTISFTINPDETDGKEGNYYFNLKLIDGATVFKTYNGRFVIISSIA